MGWTVQGSNPSGGEIFCTPSRPALGLAHLPEGKAAGAWP